jgi:tetratricopeptide (TPR) repeat protein
MDTNDQVERLLDIVGEACKDTRPLRPSRIRELRGHFEGLLATTGELRLDPAALFAAAGAAGQGRPPAEIFLANLAERVPRTVLVGRVDHVLRQGAPSRGCQEAFGERLAAIEEDRFGFPGRVRPQAHELLGDVLREVELGREDATTLCDALAEVGVVEAVLGDYPESAVFLFRGLKLSRMLDDPRREASVLRRCVTLLIGLGEDDVALGLAEQAGYLSLLSHDLLGVGKSLFVRGMLLRRLGDTADAIRCYRSALSYLPREAWQHRFTVFHGLALALFHRGEIEEARGAADQAEQEHPTRDGLNWWKLMWFRGEIALEGENLEEAETTFLQARRTFEAEGDDLDVALISLRLAKVLLLAGKEMEMRQVAADLLELLEPLLAENRLAAGIVREVAKKALVEDVTADFLDRAHDQIYKSTTA